MKKSKKIALSSLGIASTVAGTASAALPAGVATAFTSLETDGLALIDLAWPVVTALTVGFIIIGLFKKAANKAV
jgi:hypothetical protein